MSFGGRSIWSDTPQVKNFPCFSLLKYNRAVSSPGQNGSRTRLEQVPPPGMEWPFTETPRRNLIYHIWPVHGSMWKWNLKHLKRRIDLFNGKRILGIVTDAQTVTAEEVKEFMAGHGFDFVVAQNDRLGEVITFPAMLDQVASDDPNEVTMYAHAKGVKYEPNIPAPVRRWAEVQYQVTMGDWLRVRNHLQRFAMTGAFRMFGRFRAHRYLANWHYSGTCFWMRNAHVFSRGRIEIPQFYGGVETWPGTVFRKEETTCLFMDGLRQVPYYPEFWERTAEPALRRWQSEIKLPPVPETLLHPLPFKDHTKPRMEQLPEEFEWWVQCLLDAQVGRVLTIGSREGGVEWHLAREFFCRGRKIEITAIEKNPQPTLRETFSDAEQRFQQQLKIVAADSTTSEIRASLADNYDAVFIDGDHSYRASRSDFELARSLKAKLIGLHDIVDSDWHAAAHCCVSRLWAELTQQYRTEHKILSNWGGIGIVFFGH
ncbi:MAG TPA: class I SAM-dependent methyltransferase [Pyrinomonadaceae bacterium]|nr:class I SAM-dependent methyltransferase [Pyrinomonadaceae bacterium]